MLPHDSSCTRSVAWRGRRASVCLAAVLLGVGAGCASAPEGRSSIPSFFPTAAEIATLESAPAPAPKFAAAERVERWELAEPAPVVIGSTPHETASAAGALLAATFKSSQNVRPSGGMQCLAREYGRFWLAHQAMPTPELELFLQARCGEPVMAAKVLLRPGQEPGVAELQGPWRAAATELLAKVPTKFPVAAGIWAGEAQGRSVVVVTGGPRLIELEPLPVDAGADGIIELRGRFHESIGLVEAYATLGPAGYSECALVPGPPLPRFRVHCPVDAGDPTVMVEVLGSPPEHVLAIRSMLAMFSPGKPPPREYTAPAIVRSDTVMPERDRATMLLAINELRRSNRIGALSLAEAQSAVAARLLPHYVAALHGGDLKAAEKVALGMMAGWEVRGGLLRSGEFAAMSLYGVKNIGVALDAVLMTPSYRAVLLNPNAHTIALATQDHEGGKVTSALVSTYRFFGDVDYEASARRLLDKLDAQRAVFGNAPVIRVNGNSAAPLADAREAIKHGRDPIDALQGALERLVEEVGISMRGQSMVTFDLNAVTFPAELVRSKTVQIDVDIDHFKPRGSPWGLFLVLMVFTLH